MKNEAICILMILLIVSLSSWNQASLASGPDLDDAPIYNPPNPTAEKRRLEAGDTEGANRGVRVRGVRVRGVRVRSASRGSTMSSSLTDDLTDMIDTTIMPKETESASHRSFPKRLAPIASEQTGFTSSPQPCLYWYISSSFQGPMEFKLNEPRVSKPILSVTLTGSEAEGIYGIKLKDYNVKLKPDIEYEWFITIITDPEERSGDIYASATIKYVKPPNDLNSKFNEASLSKRYSVFAKNGYWYDSISSISQQIEQSATSKKLRLHRAALLKQVNLPKAARYDMSLINVP